MRTKARAYFLLTFAWSLIFWSLSVALGGIDQFPGSILQYVGGAGPLVSALILVHFFEAPGGQREFWSRTFDPRRIPSPYVLVALLIHPAILLVAIAISVALGGELQIRASDLTDPVAMISLTFFVFVFGPLPEEMGWRGVGYERLERKQNPLSASLLLGMAWAAWHIPLFLIEGTFQNELGFGSVRFWIFLASNIPLTIIITWVYNHTKKSILAAVLVHFSGNMIGAIVTKTDGLALLELIGLTLVAIILVAVSGVALGNYDSFRNRASERSN